jgi:hypothetical protein
MEASFPKVEALSADFPDSNWDALLYAIYYQKCVLLLGPGAAMEEDEGGNLRPCNDILANELAHDIQEELKRDLRIEDIDTNDLLQSAQYYQWIKNNRMSLEEKVTSFYAKRASLTSTLHRNLAQLPFSLIITSTFDNMMLNALAELKGQKQPRTEFHHYKGPKQDLVQMGSVESPLIYQFFGSLKDPGSLVITENDLLDLVVNVASKEPRLPANILSELTSESKSLLFLGFGFRYWYLRVLLHLIKIGTKASYSFALERIEPRNVEEIRRTTLFIENKRLNIKICNATLTDFVDKLVSRYQDKYGTEKTGQVVTPKPLEKPTVFISYVREDEKALLDLKDWLNNQQLEAFVDKDFLESGDDFEQKIYETIAKVDYFIILLSTEWVKQLETWALKEVDKAFERRERFRKDLKFIIPVKIDDKLKSEDLPLIHKELKNLHTEIIDLRESAGVDKIVREIRNDFQLRKRDYAS